MEQILDLADRQGYVTIAQALLLGAHEHTVGRLVATGALTKAMRGVYVPTVTRSPEATHALVTQALLDRDPWSVASHHSALALHDIDMFGVRWDQVHVADPRRSSRCHADLHRHVLRDGDRVVEVNGYRTLELPLALCQVAARFGMVPGLVAMDCALHRELCTPDDLQSVIESGRLRRGIGAARRAVTLADGRAQSPGESRLRAIVAGSPFAYDLQANLGGPGCGYQVDLLIDGCVALEFDGATKYDGADGASALIAEKRREDWIRAQQYGFMRTMWKELDYPTTVRRTLHSHVVQARAMRAA